MAFLVTRSKGGLPFVVGETSTVVPLLGEGITGVAQTEARLRREENAIARTFESCILARWIVFEE